MPLELTDTNFQDKVIDSDKLTIVDFWAEWCGPCRAIGPVIEELSKEYDGKINVGKVNVDHNPSPKILTDENEFTQGMSLLRSQIAEARLEPDHRRDGGSLGTQDAGPQADLRKSRDPKRLEFIGGETAFRSNRDFRIGNRSRASKILRRGGRAGRGFRSPS